MATLPGMVRLVLFIHLLVATPAAAFQLPIHSSSGSYTFPVDGPFYNLDVHLTWREVSKPPPGLGYYAMFAFYFQNRVVGYTGLQWDGDGKKAIFSIWDAKESPESARPEGKCKRFGHEGNGAQCIIPFAWETGREYLLGIRPVERTTGGERWQSVVRDLLTGRETVIGVIQLRDNAGHVGFGHLTGKGINVLEYYGHAKLEECKALPVVVLDWRGPFADERRMRAKDVHFSYPAKSGCLNSSVASPGTGQVQQRAGGHTERLTPEGKRIHWPQILLKPE
ncbi:MAG: DUF3472 domain-containing protein [Magnetococcus sp. DMHC-8]